MTDTPFLKPNEKPRFAKGSGARSFGSSELISVHTQAVYDREHERRYHGDYEKYELGGRSGVCSSEVYDTECNERHCAHYKLYRTEHEALVAVTVELERAREPGSRLGHIERQREQVFQGKYEQAYRGYHADKRNRSFGLSVQRAYDEVEHAHERLRAAPVIRLRNAERECEETDRRAREYARVGYEFQHTADFCDISAREHEVGNKAHRKRRSRYKQAYERSRTRADTAREVTETRAHPYESYRGKIERRELSHIEVTPSRHADYESYHGDERRYRHYHRRKRIHHHYHGRRYLPSQRDQIHILCRLGNARRKPDGEIFDSVEVSEKPERAALRRRSRERVYHLAAYREQVAHEHQIESHAHNGEYGYSAYKTQQRLCAATFLQRLGKVVARFFTLARYKPFVSRIHFGRRLRDGALRARLGIPPAARIAGAPVGRKGHAATRAVLAPHWCAAIRAEARIAGISIAVPTDHIPEKTPLFYHAPRLAEFIRPGGDRIRLSNTIIQFQRAACKEEALYNLIKI